MAAGRSDLVTLSPSGPVRPGLIYATLADARMGFSCQLMPQPQPKTHSTFISIHRRRRRRRQRCGVFETMTICWSGPHTTIDDQWARRSPPAIASGHARPELHHLLSCAQSHRLIPTDFRSISSFIVGCCILVVRHCRKITALRNYLRDRPNRLLHASSFMWIQCADLYYIWELRPPITSKWHDVRLWNFARRSVSYMARTWARSDVA